MVSCRWLTRRKRESFWRDSLHAEELCPEDGFVVPPIHIHDNLQLKPHEYSIIIKGAKVAGGNMTGQFLAMDSGAATGELAGAKRRSRCSVCPRSGSRLRKRNMRRSAGIRSWIPRQSWPPTSARSSRSTPMSCGKAGDAALLDNLAASCRRSSTNWCPDPEPRRVLKVVHNLLKENVSIRDLRTILEILADYGGVTKDPEILTEFVRQGLGRYLVDQYKQDDDVLALLTLDRQVEEVIAESVQPSDQGGYLAIEPGLAQRILSSLRVTMDRFNQTGSHPVLLASPSVRRHVKKLTERFLPNLAVLSHNEIPPNKKFNLWEW